VSVWAEIHASHPPFRNTVRADALAALRFRGEEPRGALADILRLAWQSDAFLALILYRAKARLQARGVPVLPRLAHRLAMILAQVSIGDPVVVGPGLYLPHGQVVLDGLVRIGSGAVIAPFVTVGLRAGDFRGPTLQDGVEVGTGAKIIGPVEVGRSARIAAGAVVVDDVPAGCTAAGIPARPVAAES
jgi:serine O-acetyltransferase